MISGLRTHLRSISITYGTYYCKIHKIGYHIVHIALRIDMRFGSSAVKTPAKYQIDWKKLHTDLVPSRLSNKAFYPIL